jgi:hypothetical protein
LKQFWRAPYPSDWALAIGYFDQPYPDSPVANGIFLIGRPINGSLKAVTTFNSPGRMTITSTVPGVTVEASVEPMDLVE